MKCIKCGNEIPDDSKFCSFCSSPVVSEEVKEEIVTEAVTSEVTPDVKLPKDEKTKKELDGKSIVIIVLVLLVIILICLLVLSYTKTDNSNCKCGDIKTHENEVTTTKDSSEKVNYAEGLDISKATGFRPEDENSERNKNIKFINATSYTTESSINKTNVGFLFENNNDSLMSGTVYINYYKDGTRIGSDIGSYSLVTPHSKFTVHINPSFEEEFDSFDVSYTAAMKTTGYKNIPVDNSKINTQKVKDYTSYNIIATYTNDSDSKVTYYFGVIYKKDGKDVGYRDTIASNVEKGDTASAKFYDSFAPKDYDDYEVFIYSSYTSN